MGARSRSEQINEGVPQTVYDSKQKPPEAHLPAQSGRMWSYRGCHGYRPVVCSAIRQRVNYFPDYRLPKKSRLCPRDITPQLFAGVVPVQAFFEFLGLVFFAYCWLQMLSETVKSHPIQGMVRRLLHGRRGCHRASQAAIAVSDSCVSLPFFLRTITRPPRCCNR